MRIIRLLPCVLLAVGCGDDGGGNNPPDAPRPDAPPGIDAPVDGEVDAPPIDAPPGNVARVWVVGDFLTDQRREAGAFSSDATLPFNTAAPPPIVVPGGAAELFDGTGATVNVFDARGGKIAYVADQTTALQFDLYVANADGSNPVMLVAGQAGIEITSVALSPDGTKVGFTMDGSILTGGVDGGFDLHVVSTAGGVAPVRVSPDRPVTSLAPEQQDVFFTYEWSADSTFLAFSADLTENGFDQAYAVDTTAVAPVAVELLTRAEIATQAAGAQGVRSKLLFDAANNIFFRARVTDGSSQFTLFQADTTGSKTVIAGPERGDGTTSDIGAFGITPDGVTLVFSSDSPELGTFNLFAQAAVNPQAPTNLTNLTPIATAILRAEFTTPMVFSPDGKKVAVVANYLTGIANAFEPFAINVDGTGSTRLFAIPDTCVNCDADQVVWADNATIFAVGDLAVNNDTNLFKLDAATADQTPTPAVVGPTGGDLVNVFVVAP